VHKKNNMLKASLRYITRSMLLYRKNSFISASLLKKKKKKKKSWDCNTVKLVLRAHLWDKEKVVLWDRWPLKRGQIHMNFSMTGQVKDDCLIEMTTWAGLTIYIFLTFLWPQRIE